MGVGARKLGARMYSRTHHRRAMMTVGDGCVALCEQRSKTFRSATAMSAAALRSRWLWYVVSARARVCVSVCVCVCVCVTIIKQLTMPYDGNRSSRGCLAARLWRRATSRYVV